MSQPAFYWDETTEDSVYTANSTETGLSVDSVQYATEDTWWTPSSILSAGYVIIDSIAATLYDTILLVGEGLDGISVEVRGSTDNFITSDVAVDAEAAITSVLNASIIRYTPATYRYLKVIFSDFGDTFKLNHIAQTNEVLLPFFEEDPDTDRMRPTTVLSLTADGSFLRADNKKTTNTMPLAFGEVTAAEILVFDAWAAACVQEANPFFVCVDTSTDDVYFGYSDEPTQSTPYEIGVNVMRPLEFITRAK